MRQVVVDASVAAKWVVDEAHSDQAAILLDECPCHAPDHWLKGVGNALWSQASEGDLTAEDAAERLSVPLCAQIRAAPSAGLMRRAMALSAARAVTIHASLPIAPAEERDIQRVTADQRLIRRLSDDPSLRPRRLFVGDLRHRPRAAACVASNIGGAVRRTASSRVASHHLRSFAVPNLPGPSSAPPPGPERKGNRK